MVKDVVERRRREKEAEDNRWEGAQVEKRKLTARIHSRTHFLDKGETHNAHDACSGQREKKSVSFIKRDNTPKKMAQTYADPPTKVSVINHFFDLVTFNPHTNGKGNASSQKSVDTLITPMASTNFP